MHQLVKARHDVVAVAEIVAVVVEMTAVLAVRLVLSVCVQSTIRRLSAFVA
jgi:hypothetical protein